MPTILVIDDIATNRDVLVTLLGYYGHHLLEANDGVEGLKVARAEWPDLIIADVLMPTMDGYEFVRQLRMDRFLAKTPVIFHTAHYLEKEARKLAGGCDVAHIIAKPSEPAEVLRVVELALGGGKPLSGADVPEDFKGEHLRLLTNKLAEKSDLLRIANLRLVALIQLGEKFARERDPELLVQGYCAGARNIMGAGFAGIWLTPVNTRPDGFVCLSGLDETAGARIDSHWRNHPVIIEMLETRERRLVTGDMDTGETAAELPFVSLLAVPLFSGPVVFGWLGLWNKVGGGVFSQEEAELSATLCAQLAVRYENALLYLKIEGANHDLEERVAARTNELARANVSLARSNQELEQYAYSASHDLQEPLRTIAIYSQLLTRQYRENLDARGEEYLDLLNKAARKMQMLVNDLLHYSKLVVSEADAEFPLVDLSEIVQTAKNNCATAIEEAGAIVTCGPLGKSYGRPEQLVHVFQNLISNAIRYRRADVDPVVHISGTVNDSGYLLRVEDNGMGLKMEYAEQIFKLFKRLHGPEIAGTGIGLSICKRVVENHGGHIWVDSVVGEGSVFSFTLAHAAAV